jgi:hypothetical protein
LQLVTKAATNLLPPFCFCQAEFEAFLDSFTGSMELPIEQVEAAHPQVHPPNNLPISGTITVKQQRRNAR